MNNSALQLGRLLRRTGALLIVGQPDVADAVIGDASDLVCGLSDQEARELYAFLYGFFAAAVSFRPSENRAAFQALCEALEDDVGTMRIAMIAALDAVRHV